MSNLPEAPVIFWFRRDLRLDDNIGLHAAIRSGRRVLPLFILDPRLQRGAWFSHNRMAFLLDALEALDSRLRQFGAGLLILEGDPLEVLAGIVKDTEAAALYFNRDYTPFAIARDRVVAGSLGTEIHAYDDGLLVAPHELLKDDGAPFKIYTPFRRRWTTREKPRVSALDLRREHFLGAPTLRAPAILGLARARVRPQAPLPAADESSAKIRLAQFMTYAVADYKEARHSLPIDPNAGARAAGPSFLSPLLRLGILSPRQVYWAARARYAGSPREADRQSIESFCNQLVWREFFMHIMFNFPSCSLQQLPARIRRLELARRACGSAEPGKTDSTGYPIVDAAMRQLRAIGWMPNRARMITASFLSKHLLINWRDGEAHFMRHLLDGDPGRQQRRLAVDRRNRHRCPTLLPHIQPNSAIEEV